MEDSKARAKRCCAYITQQPHAQLHAIAHAGMRRGDKRTALVSKGVGLEHLVGLVKHQDAHSVQVQDAVAHLQGTQEEKGATA